MTHLDACTVVLAHALVYDYSAGEVLLNHVFVREEASGAYDDGWCIELCNGTIVLADDTRYPAIVGKNELLCLAIENGGKSLAGGAHVAEVVGAGFALFEIHMSTAIEHG